MGGNGCGNRPSSSAVSSRFWPAGDVQVPTLCGILVVRENYEDTFTFGGVNLKKTCITTLIATSLVLTTLSACGNHKNTASSASSKTTSSLVAKKHQTSSQKPAQHHQHQAAQSHSATKTQSAATKTSSTGHRTTRTVTPAAPKQTPRHRHTTAASHSNTYTQSSRAPQSSSHAQSSVNTDPNTLTGFINKYGESPVAYKIDHGMSEKAALASTPNSMKSSGEIQRQHELGIK